MTYSDDITAPDQAIVSSGDEEFGSSDFYSDDEYVYDSEDSDPDEDEDDDDDEDEEEKDDEDEDEQDAVRGSW